MAGKKTLKAVLKVKIYFNIRVLFTFLFALLDVIFLSILPCTRNLLIISCIHYVLLIVF